MCYKVLKTIQESRNKWYNVNGDRAQDYKTMCIIKGPFNLHHPAQYDQSRGELPRFSTF